MIWGFVTSGLLAFALVRIFFRNGGKQAGDWIRKLHPAAGLLLTGAALLHGVLALTLIRQRPAVMFWLGGGMLVLLFVEVLGYFWGTRRPCARWLLIHRGAAVFLLVFLAVHIAVGIGSFQRYQNDIKAIDVTGEFNLAQLPDGIYEGAYDAGYIFARVRVTLQDQRIAAIELLEHRHERGENAQPIPAEIVRQQRVNVETVAGATNSSRVIQKAVANALESAGLC